MRYLCPRRVRDRGRPADAQQFPALDGPPVPPPAPPPLASGLQVAVTPYLWLAGINAAVSTPLARAPVINESVGPFELLGKLNGVPFMGSAEVRDGPFGLLGDVLHLPAGDNITTRNVFFQGGSATVSANVGTAVFLYYAVTMRSTSRCSRSMAASAFAAGALQPG
ncbi:MAG TPA: hypothetical protein VKG79_00640 [Bryobacteraceae bacterium]|nr:hypothetical protein [Bryobacteraceae bacterium]